MKCIVIDDEPLARKGMELLINEVRFLELIGMFPNVIEADEFIKNNPVDLIFLDIKMPGISGLEYLKITTNRPNVIITTAYPDYALDGFNLDVVDYLTKPIKFKRFYKAVNKCLKIFESDHFQKFTNNPVEDDIIFIRSDRKYVQLRLSKISHIEAMKDYVIIHHDGQRHILSVNLKSIEGKLPSSRFIRVSKSFIINTDFIVSIDKDLIDIGVCEISIGEIYKMELMKYLSSRNLIKRDY
jgi:two-component system, LytTR family, response regulator